MLSLTLEFGVESGLMAELAVVVLYGLLPLAIAAFVYRDAESRGNENALAWAVASLVGNIVVLLLWLTVRD